MAVLVDDALPLPFADHLALVRAQASDARRREDRRERLNGPRLSGDGRYADLVPAGADAPHRLAGEHTVGGIDDAVDFGGDVLAHVGGEAIGPSASETRYPFLRLAGPNGLHAIRR